MPASKQNTAEIIIKVLDQASSVFNRIRAVASKSFADTKRQADMASRSMDYMKTIAVGAAAGFGARGAWNWLIDTNSKMEQATIGFETMLGSAEKAQGFLSELESFAAKTPFEFTQLRTAATRMLAFGFASEQVLPTLTAVGDATSALGLGSEGINRVILALGQMRAKNKVSADEMLQLTEAGIPAWEILARAMNKSTAEVMKLSEKGLIPANKAIDALVQGMEQKFPDMMKKQADSMGGIISNLNDLREIAGRKLGAGLFDQIKPMAEDALKSLNKLKDAGKFEEWGRNIGSAFKLAKDNADKFAAAAAAVGAYMVFTKAVEGMAIAVTGYRTSALLATAATNGWTFALTRNPIGLIAVGLSAVIGAIVAYRLNLKETTDSTNELSDANYDLVRSYNQARQATQNTSNSIEENYQAQDALNKKTEEMKKILPDLLRMYGEEQLALDITTGKISENTSEYIRNLAVKASAAQAELERLELEQYLLSQRTDMDPLDEGLERSKLAMQIEAAGKRRDTLSAMFNSAAQQVAKASEQIKKSVQNNIDFGDLEKEEKEKILSIGAAFSQVGEAVAKASRTSLLEAKDTLQDIIDEANKMGAGGLAGQLQEAMSLLPEAVNDKTGEAGRKLLQMLHGVFSEAVGLTGQSATKIQNQYDLALSRISDRFAKLAEDAAEKSKRMSQAMEESLERAGEIRDRMNKDIQEANERYYTETAKVTEKMNEDIKKLNDDFEKTLADRANSLKNWTGLFDEVPKLAKDSLDKMTKNLRDQVDRFSLFYQMLKNLSRRGIDQGLVEELRQMGPKAAPQVLALYQATDEQLQEYVDLWKTRSQLAGEEATDQLEDTRYDMLQAQEKIREDAGRELEKLRTEWQKRLTEIQTDTSERLSEIAEDAKEQGKDFITKLLDGIGQKYPEFKAMIDKLKGDMNITTNQQSIPSELKVGGLFEDLLVKEWKGAITPAEKSKLNNLKQEWYSSYGTKPWEGVTPYNPSAQSPQGGDIWTPTPQQPTQSEMTWQELLEYYRTHILEAEAEISRAGTVYTQKLNDGDITGAKAAHRWADQIRKAIGREMVWDQNTEESPAVHDTYHEGGVVTRHGRRPLTAGEVPIIAKEGEVVSQPAVMDLTRVVDRLDKILNALQGMAGIKFDQLFKVENQHIYTKEDNEGFASRLAREVILASS